MQRGGVEHIEIDLCCYIIGFYNKAMALIWI